MKGVPMITRTMPAACALAALVCGAALAQGAPAGYAPELAERHGLTLYETLDAVPCTPRSRDPLAGARLDRRLGAVLSACTRLRIAAAAAAALNRESPVRWRLDANLLRGVILPGGEPAARPSRCRMVRLETYSASGDLDERTLTLCRSGAAWRVEPGLRRSDFSRSG